MDAIKTEDVNGIRYQIETVGSTVIKSVLLVVDPNVVVIAALKVPTLEDKVNFLYYKSKGVI